MENEIFEMKRLYMQENVIKTDVITVGMRKPRPIQDLPRPQYDGSDNDIQWVEISGCQCEITEGELLCWLNSYGEVLSKISLNNLVELDWLNLSLISFKLKLKRLLLMN